MVKKSTFNVAFILRKDKTLTSGDVPLVVRITLNGERAEFNAKVTINPEKWDSKKDIVSGSSIYAKKINSYIGTLKLSLYDAMKDLEERGMEVTAENIKNNYLGFIEFKQVTLLSLYEEHNTKMEALVGKTYSFSTLQKHLTTVAHLKDFLKREFKSEDIIFDKVNTQLLIDFEFFLKSEKNISNNTTIKYMKNLGKVVRMGLHAGYLKRDPYAAIKFHHEEVEKAFLGRSELQSLIDKKIENKRLDQVRDAFLFCCFTGLAFADVKALTIDCLYEPNKGEIWINKKRQKTKKWFHVPLLPQARSIVEKYEHHPVRDKGLLIPVPTNQKMNAYLKEIADLCDIKKNLTTHTARHTFATTITLANGVSMESVSKMLGHSSVLITKQYAKILDETIGKEMERLKDIL